MTEFFREKRGKMAQLKKIPLFLWFFMAAILKAQNTSNEEVLTTFHDYSIQNHTDILVDWNISENKVHELIEKSRCGIGRNNDIICRITSKNIVNRTQVNITIFDCNYMNKVEKEQIVQEIKKKASLVNFG